MTQTRLTLLILWSFIALYSGYFSWYTLNRHATLNSYYADLSLIDQPMWNTLNGEGYFMEQTWGNRQQPRLAEHVEPIIVPLATLLWLWDDVRILLIAQTIALALGALPVFWLTRAALPQPPSPLLWLIPPSLYLLSPHLQSANIADFHADPFILAPLLFAFWYATQQRWGWMWGWAIIAMLTKETLPPLTAMVGLWLFLRHHRKHGFGLMLVSTAWFLAATFLIVAPLARHYFGTDGPIYFANRYTEQTSIWLMLQEPARWRYIFGLLASVGFLPLLAPEMMLLGLPLLLANFFSNFAGQYSGEQHYSAPLVVPLLIATIHGLRRAYETASRFNRPLNSTPQGLFPLTLMTYQQALLLALSLWGLTWAIGYHTQHGWTPLSARTEHYTMSPQAKLLPTLLPQVDDHAVVSASAAIHPHLAHRRVIYVFPLVEEADTLLVDVTDIPGVHPVEAYQHLTAMLATDWQLLTAEHGLIFARKSPNAKPSQLPDAFYNFARTVDRPTYSTNLRFNEHLRLVGYDIQPDPDDGLTFRFHWQTDAPLPENLALWPLIYDDNGTLLSDPTLVPQIATVWYPPHRWQLGERIVTETLPQLLPPSFHLGLAVGPADSFQDPTRHWRPTSTDPTHGSWVELYAPPNSPALSPNPTPPHPASPIHLTAYRPITDLAAPIILQWQTTAPITTNYTVFIHLLNEQGERVAQRDSYPTWLFVNPTSQWTPNQPQLDRHQLELPSDLPPNHYTVQVGLYNAATMERLPLSPESDTIQIGEITLE